MLDNNVLGSNGPPYHLNPSDLGVILCAARLGMKSVVRKIAETLGYSTALVTANKEIMYAAGNHTTIQQFLKIHQRPLAEAANIPFAKAGIFRAIIRLLNTNPPGDPSEYGYLVLVARDSDFSDETICMINFIFQISDFTSIAQMNAERLYTNFASELVFNKLSAEEIQVMSSELELTGNKALFILIANGPERREYISSLEAELRRHKQFSDTIIGRFHEKREEDLCFFILNYRNESKVLYCHELRKIMMGVFKDFSTAGLYIYSGGIHDHAAQLKDSYLEAKQTKEMGSIIWSEDHILFYREIQIFKHLKSLTTKYIVFNELALLDTYKNELNFDAVSTLEAYLETLNYKKAGKRIFVHENTMRYRIQKIVDMTSLNLDDPALTLNLLIKIKLWKLIHTEV